MFTTNLGGHSGCTVLLCENDNEDVFVRKISVSLDYNVRLKLQADKQLKFESNILKVPKVLSEGYTEEGLYYFDMEYIQGITLAEKLKTVEIGKIKPIINDILKELINGDSLVNMAEDDVFYVFQSKIKELSIKLQDGNNPIIEKALNLLRVHDWSYFSKTRCHGDMTLENIIVKDSQLYLIDFLDSFYESWILDVGTLLQDSLAMWSYRSENKINNNTLVRLVVFRDILLDELENINKQLVLEVYYALLLKLIRVYPYTSDKATYSFLDTKVSEVISIIREKENSCEH